VGFSVSQFCAEVKHGSVGDCGGRSVLCRNRVSYEKKRTHTLLSRFPKVLLPSLLPRILPPGHFAESPPNIRLQGVLGKDE